jgi:DNA modification methylase
VRDALHSIYWQSSGAELHLGDALSCLRRIPAKQFHCCVTSPPYWNLRDYGEPGQLGLESVADCFGWATQRPCGECYVCHMVTVLAEVRRVLRDDGTCWLNLGDTFTDGGGHRGTGQGMIPARVALALQEDGWRLVQDIIWYSPNKMPESVTNRCSKSHEHIFLLAKATRYYYDSVAIEDESVSTGPVPGGKKYAKAGEDNNGDAAVRDMKNKRDVWIVPTQGYPGAHFATFSPRLITPCILAGTSECGCCAACGSPYERVVVKVGGEVNTKVVDGGRDRSFAWSRNGKDGSGSTLDGVVPRKETVGWQRTCGCPTADLVPCSVLDPFVGSGTTVAVAVELGRCGVGIELNEEYLRDCAVPRVEAALRGERPAPRLAINPRPDTPPPPRRVR